MNNLINESIIYHIYPFGFCNASMMNNNIEVNRISKIIEWIPYFKQLRVNVISLTPIFRSTVRGYDVVDFYRIDERLGSNNDFKKVCSELHSNGIKIIVEFPFNHISTSSEIFKDIEDNRENSIYKNWIKNLKFNSNNKSLEYDYWFGCSYYAKLNLESSEVASYIADVLRFWINEFNIDGIKLNETNYLTNNVLDKIYSVIQELNPDLWVLGHFNVEEDKLFEWYNNHKSTAVEDRRVSQGLPYDFLNSNFDDISNLFQTQNDFIQKFGVTNYNYLDNHDINRIASTIRNGNHLQNLYTLLYTMCGIPAIYYGSEWGIKGDKGNAIGGDFALRPNVELDDISKGNIGLVEHIKKLGYIRTMSPALKYGSYKKIYSDDSVFIFCRECEWQSLYIAINKSSDACEVEFQIDKFTSLTDILFYYQNTSFYAENGIINMVIEPYSSRIMVAGNDKSLEFQKSDVKINSFTAQRPIGKYRHFKGGMYEVIAFANHTERDERVVVYKSLDNNNVWVRPESIFFEKVKYQGKVIRRFEFVEEIDKGVK